MRCSHGALSVDSWFYMEGQVDSPPPMEEGFGETVDGDVWDGVLTPAMFPLPPAPTEEELQEQARAASAASQLLAARRVESQILTDLAILEYYALTAEEKAPGNFEGERVHTTQLVGGRPSHTQRLLGTVEYAVVAITVGVDELIVIVRVDELIGSGSGGGWSESQRSPRRPGIRKMGPGAGRSACGGRADGGGGVLGGDQDARGQSPGARHRLLDGGRVGG
jgi:hypothetical protein